MKSGAGTVRIAAAQYALDQFGTLDECAAKLERWIAAAAAEGADLVVFPEYGAMEFAGPDHRCAGDLAASLAVASDAMAAMQQVHVALARRYDVHILGASGPCRLPDGRIVNRAKLFAPSGVYGIQDKLMMTPFERAWGISSGSDVRVFDTVLGVIGVAICYDSEFPLLVRAMCEAGADIVLIPSCTEFLSGYHRVRAAAQARALENGCVTVQATTIGEALWSPAVDRNSGIAGIFVPSEQGLSETGVLAEGKHGVAGWTTVCIDLQHLRTVRRTGEMRNAHDWPQQPGAVPLAGLALRHRLI